MTCGGCGIDKTVTVLYGVTLVRVDPRTGRETAERRQRRLCGSCGGAMTDDEMRST